MRHGNRLRHGKARPNAGTYVEPGFPKRDGKEGRRDAALRQERKPMTDSGPFLGAELEGRHRQQRHVRIDP